MSGYEAHVEKPFFSDLLAFITSGPVLAMEWTGEDAIKTAKSLSARVASLYATELGHARPHPGGHWLKTLREQPKLRLWWAETDAPEEYEDELREKMVGAGLPVERQ